MPSIQTFAEVSGTRLYYEMAGSGNPVVFIHGFGSDSRVWDSQFKTLAEQYLLSTDPVIAGDPPAIRCLNQIQTRVLILIGELDLPDFHAISSILLESIPNARKIEIADTGHVLPMEAPEKFNEIVLSFLEGDR